MTRERTEQGGDIPRSPVLARHARYRWDPLRQQHQLVFPEGVLVLNDSGAAIVRHCNGRPVDELIAALKNEFPAADPAADIHAFLRRLAEKGLLRDATLRSAGGTDISLPAEVPLLQQPAAAPPQPARAGDGILETRAL